MGKQTTPTAPTRARQRGTGSIRERHDVPGGRLIVSVFVGRTGGKQVRKFATVPGTTAASYRAARTLIKTLEAERTALGGQIIQPTRQSLGDWLTEYLDVWCPQTSERTREDRRDEFTRCIPLDLRVRPLRELTSAHVQAWVNDMQGKGGQPLAAVTRKKLLVNLRTALKVAQTQGRLVTNVAQLAKPMKQAHRQQARFTIEQARDFLTHAKKDALYAYYLLMLKRAARPSELVALKWTDIEGDRLAIVRAMKGKGAKRVEGETKTGVRRRVVIDAELKSALDRHRVDQARRRLRMGARYVDRGYIFASPLGKPMDITGAPRKHFHEICQAAGVPPMMPYHLKHTAVSLLSEAGHSPAEIADLVGWTSPQMVLRYMEAHPQAQERTAATLDRLLALPVSS